jgi:hypothetical protein
MQRRFGARHGWLVVVALGLGACTSSETTNPGGPAGGAGMVGAGGNGGNGGNGGTPVATAGSAGGAGSSQAGSGGASAGAGGEATGMPDAAVPDGSSDASVDAVRAGETGSVDCLAAGTITVTAANALTYVINGKDNPPLTLCRGSKYTFSIDAAGSPFFIKTTFSNSGANLYSSGVTNNGTANGDVIFDVPADAPDLLYYHCLFHQPMGGELHIVN